MKNRSKAIIFFGNEKLATGVVDTRPVIRTAVESAGFAIEQIVTGGLEELQSHESKLAVLAAYGRIIPQRILDEFPLGIINIHPSLLPLYRGPTPIEQAILDGVDKTGVSIMQLTAGMDEGPIYKQKSVALAGNESKAELTERLQALGAELLVEVLPSIYSGELTPRKQPYPDRATYSHLISKQDGIIDWKKPAQQLEREIRAYAGWPGSRIDLSGKDVIITKAKIVVGNGAPGKVEVQNKDLIIYCSEGALLVQSLKPAGKKEMSASEFIRGYLK